MSQPKWRIARLTFNSKLTLEKLHRRPRIKALITRSCCAGIRLSEFHFGDMPCHIICNLQPTHLHHTQLILRALSRFCRARLKPVEGVDGICCSGLARPSPCARARGAWQVESVDEEFELSALLELRDTLLQCHAIPATS
jgi:hypothetical protein